MRTLGDELISSEVVAVIELVKNSWDADASRVLIDLTRTSEEPSGEIFVVDDGVGMTTATVCGTWLEPATSFKKSAPVSELLGRRVLGEKGIGRFAVSRLADGLELSTRRLGEAIETHALFEWQLFDDPDAYLDEIPIAVDTELAHDLAPGGFVETLWAVAEDDLSLRHSDRGTVLRLFDLRSAWERQQIQALRQGLSRLLSPFEFGNESRALGGFSIHLVAPEGLEDLSGEVQPPDALRSPHYSLSASFSVDGSWSGSMRIRGEDTDRVVNGRVPTFPAPALCGPFGLELRAWDRDQASMSALADRHRTKAARVREDLDNAAGVNIYRDGFRVLPYGDKGDDWLNLDARRVNNPTLRLSNNQISGYVLIGADTNPSLRDQTNREGLIENGALHALHSAVREMLATLEAARFEVRPRKAKADKRPKGPIFDSISVAAVSDYVTAHHGNDIELRKLLGETETQIEASIEQAEEVVARYRRLATLGQLIDKVLHDSGTPLGSIRNQALLAQRRLARSRDQCVELVDSTAENMKVILEQQDALATVFRRVQPFGGRKRGKPREIALEEVIGSTFELHAGELRDLDIEVSLPETETLVRVDTAEMQEVFLNLVQNSIYWLQRGGMPPRRITVDVERQVDGVYVLFSDSGPGVPPADRDVIFEPYFSRSEGRGQGLGLALAGEIVDEYYDGDLELLPDGPLPGATFRVILRRRV